MSNPYLKHMLSMYKINNFVVFICNIISNRFLSDFDFLGTSKTFQKQVISFEETHFRLLPSACFVSSSHFGGPSRLQRRSEATFSTELSLPRPLQDPILKPTISFIQALFLQQSTQGQGSAELREHLE